MKSANYYRHDCLDVNLNNYLRTYLFLISLVVARYLVVLCNILLVAGVTYVTWTYSLSMTQKPMDYKPAQTMGSGIMLTLF